MLKFCCVMLCALLALFTFLPCVAFAQETGWVRVVEDGVCLYATAENSKIMFQLPKSYYLKVLGEENMLYLVSVMQNTENFPQITGYVWKTEVEQCTEVPIAPYYPTERIAVCADSAQLKLSPTPSASTVLTLTNTQKMSYYGNVQSYGQMWYYVYFSGKFGYVLADCVSKPAISLHPTPLVVETVAPPTPEVPPAQTIPAEPEPVQPVTNTTEIVLIVFVALLAIGISLALFLPGNVKKREVFDRDI